MKDTKELAEVIEWMLVRFRKQFGPQEYEALMQKIDRVKGGNDETDER